MNIYQESFPLPPPDGFLVSTGFEAWSYVKGRQNFSTVLQKDPSRFLFALKYVGHIGEYLENYDVIKSSFQALSGIKLMSIFNAAQQFSLLSPTVFDIDEPITWIPDDGKYISQHHFMSANLFVSLYGQSKEGQTHYVECGICKVLKHTHLPMSITQLYMHSEEEHLMYCKPMTAILSMAKPFSDVCNLEYSFFQEYYRIIDQIEDRF